MKPLRVLVVDDTVVYRKIVGDLLVELPDVEVVGTAQNGKIALARILSLKPDLLMLDIEMPEMNGLEVLAKIRIDYPEVGAIVLSSFTQKGGDMTMRALELGAFDFVPKPEGGSFDENRKAVGKLLVPMLRAYSRRKEMKSILRTMPAATASQSAGRRVELPTATPPSPAPSITVTRAASQIIVIGISTGGPNALSQMLPKLPGNIGVPVLIVQHMPPVFTRSLADNLKGKCSLEVSEATDGERLVPNKVLIAPGGMQMKVVDSGEARGRLIRITGDPPENSCKPSVDYLFRSIAHNFPGRATGVIMTGMGSDGVLGLRLMKRTGCTIIAQDQATSVVYGMPREAVNAGIVDVIAPLDRIAAEICRTVRS